MEELCRLFHRKPFLPGSLPVRGGYTSNMFKLGYTSYACIFFVSVLRCVAF